MIYTTHQVVDMVRQGFARRGRSYLILVPPGCSATPDMAAQLERTLAVESRFRNSGILVAGDSVSSEREFVNLVIRKWCDLDAHSLERWRRIQDEVGALPEPQRLTAFFDTSLAGSFGRTLVIKRFDKLFMSMSSALLAVLRDLELAGRLIAVNTSVLKYAELYSRRAKRDPTFVSDYGQSHAKLMVGAISGDEAWTEWVETVGTSGDERRDKAYFTVAYEASAGLPALFASATAYLGSMLKDQDVRPYRGVLNSQLRPEFARLLKYDEDDTGAPALTASVARIYWKIGSDTDRGVVRSYRWGELLMVESGDSSELTSPLVGRCAVEMLREAGQLDDPEVLYRRRQFRTCARLLETLKGNTPHGLLVAAQMMSEAFGDETEGLYFADSVNWKHVEQLARRGEQISNHGAAAEEFRDWARIAMAMKEESNNASLVSSLIRIGLRVLAVRADRNSVTAAYTAIPLVEDALRAYIAGVHQSTPDGRVFESFSDEDIAVCWKRGGFRRPNSTERLSGAGLVVLSALLSNRAGRPLFESADEIAHFVDRLDQRRNLLGHHIETPDRGPSRELADATESILERAAAHADIVFSVRALSRWITPPQAVLSGQ